MNGVAAIVGLAVLEYMIFGVLVRRARGTYHVPAPATTGDPPSNATFGCIRTRWKRWWSSFRRCCCLQTM